MSATLIRCGCCTDDTPEDTARMDADLAVPVCPECKTNLNWSHAYLKRRTADGVSITGIHGPREQPIAWDPNLADAEFKRWLDSQP